MTTYSNGHSINADPTATAMKVLVVGIDKTGTSCVRTALETVYDSKCLHFHDLFHLGGAMTDQWLRLTETTCLDKGRRQVELRSLLQQYSLASGFPISAHLEDLLVMYPSAKIILTIRDAETWLATIRSTTLPRIQTNSQSGVVQTARDWLGLAKLEKLYRASLQKVLGSEVNLDDDTQLLNAYVRWNEHVQRSVPPQRLLVYNIKYGWSPLCHFLEKPIPSMPFPGSRRRSSLIKWDKQKMDHLAHWIVCCSAYTLFGVLAVTWVK